MEETKSSWSSLFLLEVVLALSLLSYWCFPVTMNLQQEITIWFDWFRLILNNLFYIFILLNTIIVLLIYISLHKPTGKTNSDLFDEYFASVPTVIHASPVEYNCYREIKPAFQTVKIVEENNCYDCDFVENTILRDPIVYEVVEETQHSTHTDSLWEESSKSYRRTMSEMRTEKKKKKKKNSYGRMESERVTKTASWRSESFDGLSSKEFQITVETFIKEKKKTLFRDNCAVNQWQNSVSMCQNGVVQLQGTCENGSGGRRRGRSLVGGSGSNGYGSYLTISK